MPTPKIYKNWSGFLGGYAAVVSCILFLSVLVVAVILFTIPDNWVGQPGSWRVGTFFAAMLISLCSSVLLQIHSFQRRPWVHRLPLIGSLFGKAAGSLTPWLFPRFPYLSRHKKQMISEKQSSPKFPLFAGRRSWKL